MVVTPLNQVSKIFAFLSLGKRFNVAESFLTINEKGMLIHLGESLLSYVFFSNIFITTGLNFVT